MNKKALFAFLKQQAPSTLCQLLEAAFVAMTTNQRRDVFGKLKFDKYAPKFDEKSLLKKVGKFYDDSIRGAYYAPFNMNSKNYMNIPEETEAWFEDLSELLEGAAGLSEEGKHTPAVECFKILYELINKMEHGDEIVFADECGSWMIPGGERVFIRAYLHSLSSIHTPEEYTEAVMPLLQRDSCQSLHNNVYKVAIEVAGREQRKALETAVKSRKIKVIR